MVISLIVGALASIGPAVTSAISSLGPMTINAISSIGSLLSKMGTTVVELLSKSSTWDVIDAVSNVFGALQPHESSEQMGAKAKAYQDDFTLDDYDSVNEYIDALREQPDVDLAAQTSEDAMVSKVSGLGLVSEAISENKNVDVSPGFLLLAVASRLSPENITSIINTFSQRDIPLSNLKGYLEGNLSIDDNIKISNTLVDVIKATDKVDENQASEKVLTLGTANNDR